MHLAEGLIFFNNNFGFLVSYTNYTLYLSDIQIHNDFFLHSMLVILGQFLTKPFTVDSKTTEMWKASIRPV